MSGWVLAVGACLSIGLVDGMAFWAFSLFVAPLEGEFGWSAADVSAALSFTLLLQGAASILVGRLVDRHGPRRVMLIGTVGVGAAYLGVTLVTTLWQFYAVLGVLAFFQSWVLYVPCTTLVTRWFTHHRTTALSIVMSGFNVGGLLVLPLLTELLEATDWRTSFATVGILVLTLNGIFVAVMRDSPPSSWIAREARGYEDAERRRPPLLGRVDGAAVYLTPEFWLLALGFACFYFSFLAFLYHGPHLLEDAGVPARYAALIFSCAAGTGLVIRLTSGAWLMRFDRHEVVASAAVLFMVVGVLMLLTGASVPALTAFVLLWGIGSGIAPTLEPVLAGRLFGRKQYASVYGTLDGIGIFVSIPGPWLGGVLAESGGYGAVAALYGGVLLLAAASFALLAHRLPRQLAPDAHKFEELTAASSATIARSQEANQPQDAESPAAGFGPAPDLLEEGRTLARAGKRMAAHNLFVRVTDLDPKCEEGWLWRAATAERSDEAIACLEHLLHFYPGNVRALRGLESLRLTKRVTQLEARMAETRTTHKR